MKRLCRFVLFLCAPACIAPADTIRFTGEISAADSAKQSVTVRHFSTGYEIPVRLEKSVPLSLIQEVDIDEIPAGRFIRLWAGKDKITEKTITLGSQRFVLLDGTPSGGINLPEISGELIRRKVRPDDSANMLRSRDGKEVFGIRITGQDRMFLSVHETRPHVHVTKPGAFSDFKPGRETDVVLQADGRTTNIVNATVYDRLPAGEPYYMNKPGGPTGVTVQEIHRGVSAANENRQKIETRLAELMPVKMTVQPELVKPGEPVMLRMEVLADRAPASKPSLTLNHIQENPSPAKELELNWKSAGAAFGKTRYVAEVQLPSSVPGQHIVNWVCDAGGDIPEFYRNYAVVTPETAICAFQINNFPPDLQAVFFELKLPFHAWMPQTLQLNTWSNPETIPARWAEVSRIARRTGSAPEYGLGYFPWAGGQVREDPPDVQRAGLEAIQQMAPLFNFSFGADTFWHYTMGTETVNLARELGFKSVSALCTEFHCDGNMAINHFGHPERPYFISPEDFRKNGLSPDGKNMIGLAQVQRHTLMSRDYRCTYNFEPGNGAFVIGAGGRKVWDDIALSRVFDAYDAFFQLQESQTVPLVIQQCLEFSGSRGGAAEGNRMMPRYAVEKARRQPVVFATSYGIADYYLRHYTNTPETVTYQQDYWAAFTAPAASFGNKPVVYPDYMQLENALFNVYSLHGEILPVHHYDYTKPWNYPDFGNETMKRRRDGFGYPAEDHDRYAVTPKITDTRNMRAVRNDSAAAGGSLVITLTVDSDEVRENFPLAIWDIAREFRKGDEWYNVSAGRFVPVKAPYSGNLNGFVVTNLKQGRNEITLTVSTPARAPVELNLDCGALLAGKVFERDGRTMAYVAPARPWNMPVKLIVPEGRSVTVAIAPEGELQVFAGGTHSFVIPKEQWARIIGLSREELIHALSAERD